MEDNEMRTQETAAIMADIIQDSMYENLPPITAEKAIASHIKTYLSQLPTEYNVKALKRFVARFPNSQYNEEFAKLRRLMDRKAPGEPEIDFSFKTVDGKEMKLSDLKGSVVYVDFWASWCVPCVLEMKKAKELIPAFKDKDVVFLFVSLDREADKWQEALEKLKIEGMHALLGGGLTNPVAKLYGLESVPASFLIDKKGKFAIAHMPRPSEKEAFTAAIRQAVGN